MQKLLNEWRKYLEEECVGGTGGQCEFRPKGVDICKEENRALQSGAYDKFIMQAYAKAGVPANYHASALAHYKSLFPKFCKEQSAQDGRDPRLIAAIVKRYKR